ALQGPLRDRYTPARKQQPEVGSQVRDVHLFPLSGVAQSPLTLEICGSHNSSVCCVLFLVAETIASGNAAHENPMQLQLQSQTTGLAAAAPPAVPSQCNKCTVAKKFDIPTLDLKVYDESQTEVDEEVFEFLLMKQDLGVLEICLPRSQILMMIEGVLKNKPGGERILNEYARTKSLTDSRRRDMVKILVAHMTSEHGTSPSRHIKEDYAKGITALFPYLADPRSKFGYEHFYNAEDGSGYLAWRLKFVQKESSEGQKKTPRQSLTGGPIADREPYREENWLTTESLCCEAIALMKHTADEAIVKEKMKQTFSYRQKMVHDPIKASEIFTAFPRFLDIAGMIEQDFNLMFGGATSAKFLEKWPTVYKQKVLEQSRGLTQTGELQDLVQNAESTTEVENGWDNDMSSILVLVHLLPPSPHGRKRPGKLSAKQASDHLVKFIKVRLN
ncbi:uncharacterized protein LOC116683406, partial [Etheostoma spectabile]|uniref:uncharacterized protein LOC116683406 n=1 Tax=Etheostoma spectabile TaxID=54343 RepID=UPI0013AEC95A